MTSVAAPSPLLALADPSFARMGQAGDGFAPVLASLLAPAVAPPVAPAIGTTVPLPGKPLPAGDGLPDIFEDLVPPPASVDVPFKEPGSAALPLAGEVAPLRLAGAVPKAVAGTAPALLLPADEPSSPSRAAPPSDVEAAPRPLLPERSMPRLVAEAAAPPPTGAGEQPVSHAPAPRPQATPEADQGSIKPTVVAGIPAASLPERKEASPSLPKSAAAATTAPVSDRPTKADGRPASIVLPTPAVALAAAPEAPTTTSTARAAATVRSPVPVATIETPSTKTGHAPRPARFAPPMREPASEDGDAVSPAVAATDAPEKGSERDEQVAAVEPAPPPSAEQGVVAAAMPPPVPLTPLADPVREDGAVVSTRATGRVAASPVPVSIGPDPVVREVRGAAGERALVSAEPVPVAPAAPAAPAALPPRVNPPVAPVASRLVPPRKQGEPVVDATAVVTPQPPEPVLSVAAALPAAVPVTERAVASEPVPVAVPKAAVRVAGGAVPPSLDDVQTPTVRPTSTTPSEATPTVTVEPRPDTGPRAPARVAPVEQPRIELAAPVILPAFQAFGAQLHRAAAAERRPLAAIDASVLIAPAATPVAVPTDPTPVDVTRPDWPQAMVARIEQLRERHDETDTRIRLHPDALGMVEVTLRRDEDGTHVRLDAAEPATARLLADAQPRLQALAETRGLRLAGSEVAGGNAQGSTGGWSGNDRRPPAPAPLAPARRPTADTPDDFTDTRLA